MEETARIARLKVIPKVNVGDFERDWVFTPTMVIKQTNKREMSSEYDRGAAAVLDVEGFLSGETIKICKHFLPLQKN